MTETRSFQPTRESVAAARRFATDTLHGVTAERLEAIELMVSELATNCVRHTDGGFELRITQRWGEIRVEATDRGAGEPSVRSPAPTDPTGRGLQIIDMLSDAWGYHHHPEAGKTVWFTLSAPATAPGPGSGPAHEQRDLAQ